MKFSSDTILTAYRRGYFPMAEGKHGEIDFYAFPMRALIPLDDRFTVRRSVLQAERKEQYKVTYDLAFEKVIRACARHATLPDEEVWLSEELMPFYLEMHSRGIAHSVEVWKSGELVGGLYGLHLGSAFMGESMFSAQPYTSQIALVHLVERLRKSGFTLLDAQMSSEHLKQFGLYEVKFKEYVVLLEAALNMNATF